MNRDMEEKGMVFRELSCRTAAASVLAAAEAFAAVRQLQRCTPGAELPRKLSGCSGGCPLGAENFGSSPAEKGIVLPELSCRRVPPAGAARPLAAQELLRSTTEDLSKDGWLAAAWKQEWERAGPTQIHHYILDPGDGATGDLLPRRQWTLLNRLRTGVGTSKFEACISVFSPRRVGYVKGGRNLGSWTMWVALETYLQLQEAFGWAAFKKVFAAYHDMSDVAGVNKGKMNLYTKTFPLAVEHNLCAFFKAWGWPIEAATEEELSKLPPWTNHPNGSLSVNLPIASEEETIRQGWKALLWDSKASILFLFNCYCTSGGVKGTSFGVPLLFDPGRAYGF
ncbi:unnamed protein product [Boreogadus saida]